MESSKPSILTHPLKDVKNFVGRTLFSLSILIPINKGVTDTILTTWIYSIIDNISKLDSTKEMIKGKNLLVECNNNPHDIISELVRDVFTIRNLIRECFIELFSTSDQTLTLILKKNTTEYFTEKKKLHFKEASGFINTKLTLLRKLIVYHDQYLSLLSNINSLTVCGQKDRIISVGFGWSFSYPFNQISIYTISDEIILTYYNIFVLRLELILCNMDSSQTYTIGNNIDSEDGAINFVDEIGICLYIIKKMTSIKQENTNRYNDLENLGILPSSEQISILSKWLFILKREAIIRANYKEYLDITDDTPDYKISLKNIATLSTIISFLSKYISEYIAPSGKINPKYRGVLFVLKWCIYANYFYTLLSQWAMMKMYHCEGDISMATLWRTQVEKSLETGKKLYVIHNQMKAFYDLVGVNNNSFSVGYFGIDKDIMYKENKRDFKCNQLMEPDLSISDLIFNSRYIRTFDTTIFFDVSNHINRCVKELEKEGVRFIHINLEKNDKVVIDIDPRHLERMNNDPFSSAIPVEIPSPYNSPKYLSIKIELIKLIIYNATSQSYNLKNFSAEINDSLQFNNMHTDSISNDEIRTDKIDTLLEVLTNLQQKIEVYSQDNDNDINIQKLKACINGIINLGRLIHEQINIDLENPEITLINNGSSVDSTITMEDRAPHENHPSQFILQAKRWVNLSTTVIDRVESMFE
jgi:hypothetical protein